MWYNIMGVIHNSQFTMLFKSPTVWLGIRLKQKAESRILTTLVVWIGSRNVMGVEKNIEK